MPTPLELNKVYTFNTLASSILGSQIKSAKLLAILDYSTAVKFANIDLLFRQIYPALPANTPNNPLSCVYYLFDSQSGEKIVLADQWIDMLSVDVVEHINIQVNFTGASVADISRIRDALNSLGYMNYVITQT
jgi:hypothetical protein